MIEFTAVSSSVVEGEETVEEYLFRCRFFAIKLKASNNTNLYSFKAFFRVLGIASLIVVLGLFYLLIYEIHGL